MRLITLLMAFLLLFSIAVAEETPVTLYEAPLQITLTFTGDCTLGNTPLLRGRPAGFENHVEENGIDYPFAHAAELFSQDDLTIINLEGTFHDSEEGVAKGKTYTFRSPTAYARMLPQASVEVCYLGNNHVYDYGEPGYLSTTKALEENGIRWFGSTEFGNETFIYEKGNAKIGFVSIYISHWWQDGMGNEMKETVRRLKEEEGCQVVIACIHGGVEYDKRHDKNQEKMADAFIRYGADIVVGNHPHVIQGLRVENGKTTLWSLGNFVFGGNKEVKSIRTYIARFTLSFDENGTYLGHQLNIIPAHMSGSKEKNNYQPVLIQDEKEAGKILEAIQYDVKKLKLKPWQPGIGALQEFVPAPVPQTLAK